MKSYNKLNIKTLKTIFGLFIIGILFACASNTQLSNQNENDSQMSADSLIYNLKSGKISSQTIIKLPKAKYHFHKENAFSREYYISNHDQGDTKKSALIFENLKNIVIDGQGSEIILHDKMIAFSFINCENIILKNFSIDYALPTIRQIIVLEIDKKKNEIKVEIYPSGNYKIENNQLFFTGNSSVSKPQMAMAFKQNGRLAYMKSDLIFNPKSIQEISADTLIIQGWEQIKDIEQADIFALRDYSRPHPGIFISESKNINISNVKVHFADGMGLLAQMTENIYLNKFSVCLRKNDKRYFTTQADATHFSACKGEIISKNGLYEAMADDAINVHGTYLSLKNKVDKNTVQAQYMHPQTWGFKWAEIGDSVQFIDSERMEIIENQVYTIKDIKAID
ncbi:MAG: alpha-1,3-galactosidase B, partial [Bacteroidales bacterium]|nr:alpha-1,3-galactosidase B [Bacteroidales bacterium]